MSSIEEFQQVSPSTESFWRSIILFGRNVASYKFALAKSLLEIAPTQKNVITLEELAEPFSRYLCEHIAVAPRQATSNSSQFLEACKSYNTGEITKEQLLDVTVKKGFNNVIDAFHVVNCHDIPISFYIKDYSKGSKKIILTDEIFGLLENQQFNSFMKETEARWNLVETAWENRISRNLLNIEYNDETKEFFVDNNLRRKDVTSARDALNGYQKGKCFYCFDDISIEKRTANVCNVDHFYPHTLKTVTSNVNMDGVWNLVLACPKCNKGVDGKFAKVPAIKYLKRLSKRNEYLISSHHPLRETLIRQTGANLEERQAFLRKMDAHAINNLLFRWETEQVGEEVF